MNSIHFHFHQSENRSFSLPDCASAWTELLAAARGQAQRGADADYQKLVDSLEDYLHEAADELATPENKVDSIVMVMRPGKAPEVMSEGECWEQIESRGQFDCLEVVSDEALDVGQLAVVFDDKYALCLGKERYLLGPVIVYKCDDEGDGVSLTAQDVIAAVVYFADHTETLCADGADFPAFHL